MRAFCCYLRYYGFRVLNDAGLREDILISDVLRINTGTNDVVNTNDGGDLRVEDVNVLADRAFRYELNDDVILIRGLDRDDYVELRAIYDANDLDVKAFDRIRDDARFVRTFYANDLARMDLYVDRVALIRNSGDRIHICFANIDLRELDFIRRILNYVCVALLMDRRTGIIMYAVIVKVRLDDLSVPDFVVNC